MHLVEHVQVLSAYCSHVACGLCLTSECWIYKPSMECTLTLCCISGACDLRSVAQNACTCISMSRGQFGRLDWHLTPAIEMSLYLKRCLFAWSTFAGDRVTLFQVDWRYGYHEEPLNQAFRAISAIISNLGLFQSCLGFFIYSCL